MLTGHKVRVAWRRTAVWASAILPPEQSLKLERYLRGKEESRLLRQADVVVVSFGKSGRTWLCVLMSRYYQLRYGLPSNLLLINRELHALNRAVPRVFFTHDNYIGDYTGTATSKAPYASSKVVLLVRHPADIAVSQFFQWKHRMRERKKFINAYPTTNPDLKPFEFALDERAGIPKIVGFLNSWASDFDLLNDVFVVRYETLRQATAQTLGHILRFMGETPTVEELTGCAEFASVENMRAMEEGKFFKGLGDRMRPSDVTNPDSYKVRRAKVGGYRDYFTEEQTATIEELIAATLSPAFGYGPAQPDPRVV
jgi:hypothetical protein